MLLTKKIEFSHVNMKKIKQICFMTYNIMNKVSFYRYIICIFVHKQWLNYGKKRFK